MIVNGDPVRRASTGRLPLCTHGWLEKQQAVAQGNHGCAFTATASGPGSGSPASCARSLPWLLPAPGGHGGVTGPVTPHRPTRIIITPVERGADLPRWEGFQTDLDCLLFCYSYLDTTLYSLLSTLYLSTPPPLLLLLSHSPASFKYGQHQSWYSLIIQYTH
ncbi:hypothetical protein BO71DRAFT_74920 [Aspergillus ellipticus CBS 707.79]|uniref:Uncharacterized protein n=1 Tax=Aspergillus ellipticus CBS 707.79 TaxID=1448320 RepID=A0A319CZU4_9EURO|nr:hypothetical protein BO71DRAFT_74920 [Aspergillus ellipticus CBS 707.79]